MQKKLMNQDYQSPVAATFSVEEKEVLCTSVGAKSEDFDQIDDFEW